MRKKCYICNTIGKDGLCSEHALLYRWDAGINGFRLRKRNTGSRYTTKDYHKSEIELTKIIEQVYGFENVLTSYRPLWAKSTKGVLLEFDIFIKSKNILIEYNGRQHYEYVPFFHKSYKIFEDQKKRDKRKKKLAIKNEMKLIVFKYDEPIFKDYIVNKIGE
jgi:hypothetical protein